MKFPAHLAGAALVLLAACGGQASAPSPQTGSGAPASQATSDSPGATAGGAATGSAPLPSVESPVFTGGANQMEVTLYFVRADSEALLPETRSIFRTATVNDRARQTLQALFGGSETGLQPSVPEGTRALELFLGNDGIAYVDLSAEFKSGLLSGSTDAVSAVYSIVNTLTSNFSEIQKVKILVEGDEVDDLGGHLDLSRPLLPEMSLVRTGAPRGSHPLAPPSPAHTSPAPVSAPPPSE